MKTGTMKKEGYFKNVLNILECHVETRAMMSPGKKVARRLMKSTWLLRRLPFLMDWLKTTLQNNVLYIFPSRLMRLTQARRKNLRVKRLVPGKILQGPVFRTFDKPKADVKKDDAKVTKKKY